MDLIYALLSEQDIFYVGRTSRTLQTRFREHQYCSKNGTEAKYQKIRELEKQGKSFEIALLCEVNPNDLRYEDFWVYSLILEGCELTNMRSGDAKAAAENQAMLEMKSRGERFTNAKEFLSARDREIEEAKARKANKKLLEKTRSKEIDVERTRFAGDFSRNYMCEEMSQAMKEIIGRRK